MLDPGPLAPAEEKLLSPEPAWIPCSGPFTKVPAVSLPRAKPLAARGVIQSDEFCYEGLGVQCRLLLAANDRAFGGQNFRIRDSEDISVYLDTESL